jgi:hypothetical protein
MRTSGLPAAARGRSIAVPHALLRETVWVRITPYKLNTGMR